MSTAGFQRIISASDKEKYDLFEEVQEGKPEAVQTVAILVDQNPIV